MQKPEAADQQLALGIASGPPAASMNRSGDRAASHPPIPSPRSLLEPSHPDRLMDSLLRNQREASGHPAASRPEAIQLEDKRKDETSQESESFSVISGSWHVQDQSLSGSWTQMTDSPEKESPDKLTGSASGHPAASTEGTSRRDELTPKNERDKGVTHSEQSADDPRSRLETKQDSDRTNAVLIESPEADKERSTLKYLAQY